MFSGAFSHFIVLLLDNMKLPPVPHIRVLCPSMTRRIVSKCTESNGISIAIYKSISAMCFNNLHFQSIVLFQYIHFLLEEMEVLLYFPTSVKIDTFIYMCSYSPRLPK